MLRSISTPPRNPWLLVSDIDDTLTGDEEALEELVALISESPDLLLVLNSSRPRASVERTLKRFPSGYRPDGLVTALGTEVALGERIEEWQARFGDWNRAVVDEIMTGLGARPHDDEFQTRFKASYAVEGMELQAEVRRMLERCGQPLRVITSGASDFDILPPNAGKGDATRFVARELGIDAGEHLVVAGDSGNDLAMFAVSRRGILVGNAREELRSAVEPQHSYQAQAAHAGGVLEGLRYWGAPLPEAGAPVPKRS